MGKFHELTGYICIRYFKSFAKVRATFEIGEEPKVQYANAYLFI